MWCLRHARADSRAWKLCLIKNDPRAMPLTAPPSFTSRFSQECAALRVWLSAIQLHLTYISVVADAIGGCASFRSLFYSTHNTSTRLSAFFYHPSSALPSLSCSWPHFVCVTMVILQTFCNFVTSVLDGMGTIGGRNLREGWRDLLTVLVLCCILLEHSVCSPRCAQVCTTYQT